MTSREQLVKTRVGIFVFISLIMLAIMVIYFGRLGDGFRNYYRINATFPSAAGLLKGADVQMAGARIGIVEEKPKIIHTTGGSGVEVPLQIYENVQIPSKARLMIRRTGLLGDRYVEVIIKDQNDWDSPPIPAGGTQAGSREAGMDDLTIEAEALVSKAQAKMDKVGEVVDRLNATVLSEQTLKQAAGTIENLNISSQKFADASQKIDGIMTDVQKASKELQGTIEDAHVVIRDTKNGRGMLGMLLTDRTMAENLRAFVLNLRERGILWYKDTSGRGR